GKVLDPNFQGGRSVLFESEEEADLFCKLPVEIVAVQSADLKKLLVFQLVPPAKEREALGQNEYKSTEGLYPIGQLNAGKASLWVREDEEPYESFDKCIQIVQGYLTRNRQSFYGDVVLLKW
ncbi:MAG: hypothetical protein MUD08_03890, partial [Cytophagales bacterium]|nr:hypothetical protein [Cytophagales bacterium]